MNQNRGTKHVNVSKISSLAVIEGIVKIHQIVNQSPQDVIKDWPKNGHHQYPTPVPGLH